MQQITSQKHRFEHHTPSLLIHEKTNLSCTTSTMMIAFKGESEINGTTYQHPDSTIQILVVSGLIYQYGAPAAESLIAVPLLSVKYGIYIF